ncbi:unnamed protein product, partial [Iphiclides podalirius]
MNGYVKVCSEGEPSCRSTNRWLVKVPTKDGVLEPFRKCVDRPRLPSAGLHCVPSDLGKRPLLDCEATWGVGGGARRAGRRGGRGGSVAQRITIKRHYVRPQRPRRGHAPGLRPAASVSGNERRMIQPSTQGCAGDARFFLESGTCRGCSPYAIRVRRRPAHPARPPAGA